MEGGGWRLARRCAPERQADCALSPLSQVRLLLAGAPRASPRLVQARAPGLEYFVEHSAGQLYILSNAGGCERAAAVARADAGSSRLCASGDSRGSTYHSSNSTTSRCSSGMDYSLFRVPTNAPSLSMEHWTPVLLPRQGVAIEDMDMFSAGLVLYERRAGRPAASLLRLRGGLPDEDGSGDGAAGGGSCTAMQELRIPGWAFSVVPGANADYHAPRLRLTLSSPIQPDAPLDVDLSTGGLLEPGSGRPDPGGVRAAAEAAVAAGGHRKAAYVCRQMWAQAGDGTRVPMTGQGRAWRTGRCCRWQPCLSLCTPNRV